MQMNLFNTYQLNMLEILCIKLLYVLNVKKV